MDRNATRRANLSRLIETRFDGHQKAFADAVGREANYISRLLGGVKNLGEDLALEFESKLRLPKGFFDEVDPPAMVSSPGVEQPAPEPYGTNVDSNSPIHRFMRATRGLRSDQIEAALSKLEEQAQENERTLNELSRLKDKAA